MELATLIRRYVESRLDEFNQPGGLPLLDGESATGWAMSRFEGILRIIDDYEAKQPRRAERLHPEGPDKVG